MPGINDIWSEFKQTGSTKSFRKLYDACYDLLYRYASFYVDNLDAEEVVLDLMLYLWGQHRNPVFSGILSADIRPQPLYEQTQRTLAIYQPETCG